MVTGAAADTRRVNPGDLFVAIVGARADGHDFAESAMSGGAVGVLGSRRRGQPTVVVDEPLLALGRLGPPPTGPLPDTAWWPSPAQWQDQHEGSDRPGCCPAGASVAPEGSFNTEVGLPLTVLQSDAATRPWCWRWGPGGWPCRLVVLDGPPEVAVVLNVGSAPIWASSAAGQRS